MTATTDMVPVLGDWVVCERHGYEGRVYAIHHECPENEAWIRGQTIPVTTEQRRGRWASVLCHGGGAVVMPIGTIRVLDDHPAELDNLWADVYFREGKDDAP